jgi:hypothetical protein
VTDERRLSALIRIEATLTELNRSPRILFTPAEIEAARQILFIVRRWCDEALHGAVQ